MNEDERGDAFRGIPKLRLLVLLEYYLGGALGIPNIRVFSLLILLISKFHPKLENFTTQNSTENS